MRNSTRLLASALALLPFTFASAANAPRVVVGTALSSGNFEIAHTAASNNATVLDGDEVSSNASVSRVMLRGGAELDLQPNTVSSFFADHAILQEGTANTHLSPQYAVISRDFTVKATQPQTEAILQTSLHSLTVSVKAGGADVINGAGVKLTHMAPGTTLDFGTAYGSLDRSVNVARLMGVLDSENGHYLVRDRYSNAVSELVGPVDPKLLNHLVMVDGNVLTNDKPDVQQVDNVVSVSKVAKTDAAFGLPCIADGVHGVAKIVKLAGNLTKVRDHFLLADKNQGTYELVGDVEDKDVGTNMNVKGFLLDKREAVLPAEHVVYTEMRKFIATDSPCVGAIVAGSLITTGVLLIPGNAAATAAKTQPVISF
jgi:hypothetical protein